MSANNIPVEKNLTSWTGIVLLAACTFSGCSKNTEAEKAAVAAFNAQQVTPISTAVPEIAAAPQARFPQDQPLLDQTVRLEKALNLIRSESNESGFKGSDELKTLILDECKASRQMILAQVRISSDSVSRDELERLFEKLVVVENLFADKSLGKGQLATGPSSTDGSMTSLYELQARLMLTRLHLTEAP